MRESTSIIITVSLYHKTDINNTSQAELKSTFGVGGGLIIMNKMDKKKKSLNIAELFLSFSVHSCEIIRDWKTGESLCYAFIEFEKVGLYGAV